MWKTILLWIKGLFGGPKGALQVGKGNKAITQSSTGENSPVINAGRDIHLNIPVSTPKETIDIYSELEEIMADLLGELRENIIENPLLRDIIILPKKSIPYGWPNLHLPFYEDEHLGIRDKINVLVNQGHLKEIKDDFAYKMSEEFVRYLKKQ